MAAQAQAVSPRSPGVIGRRVSGWAGGAWREAGVSVDAGAWRPRASADAMRTFRFGGKRIFRSTARANLQSAKKIKIVAFAKKGERAAWSLLLRLAAREGAAPRPSWAGAPLAHDAQGNGGCSRREGRHLYAVASHKQRTAHSNRRARWNQQVPQRPPIAGWAACLSGVGARLDQAAKLAASPRGQELKKARTVYTPQENVWQGKVLGYSSFLDKNSRKHAPRRRI
jgi:hypothetical protein